MERLQSPAPQEDGVSFLALQGEVRGLGVEDREKKTKLTKLSGVQRPPLRVPASQASKVSLVLEEQAFPVPPGMAEEDQQAPQDQHQVSCAVRFGIGRQSYPTLPCRDMRQLILAGEALVQQLASALR